MKEKPPGAGKESFGLVDVARLFEELHLSRARIFLDLGCGPGKYSLEAARRLHPEGKVIAMDLWPEGLKLLKQAMVTHGVQNVFPVLVDLGQSIPLKDRSADVCLIANVLHDLACSRKEKEALNEMARVLKPQGTLAIVEYKKIPGPPGPPLEIRIGAQELPELVESYGFKLDKTMDVGPYHYLVLFHPTDS